MTAKPTLHELLEQLAERLEANKAKNIERGEPIEPVRRYVSAFDSARDVFSFPPVKHARPVKRGMLAAYNYYGETIRA